MHVRRGMWNWIILILSAPAMFFYLVHMEGMSTIQYMLKIIDYGWLGISMLLILCSWLLDTAMLFVMRKAHGGSFTFFSLFRCSMIGFMFGSLTPLHSGNIPSQMLILKASGMDSGDAASVSLAKNTINTLALAVCMTVALIAKSSMLLATSRLFFWLVILGVVLNILLILGLVLASLAQQQLTAIVFFFIGILKRLHILHHEDLAKERAIIAIKRLRINAINLLLHKDKILVTLLIGIGYWILQFSVTYCIYKSFSLSQAPYLNVVSGQVFTTTIQSIIPIPGGLGVADTSYLVILRGLFTKKFIRFALILWRIFTFYLPILCALFLLIPTKSKKI